LKRLTVMRSADVTLVALQINLEVTGPNTVISSENAGPARIRGIPICYLKAFATGSLDYARDDELLKQFQSRQILRINNADGSVVVVNHDQIVDAMTLEKVENLDRKFVFVHAHRVQCH